MDWDEANEHARKAFAERLKAYIEASGMSKKRLAEAAHVVPQSVINWTQAECDPNLRQLRGLSAALGIPMASLVEDQGESSVPDPRVPQLLAELAALQLSPAVRKLGDSAPSLLDLLAEAERLTGGDDRP